MQIRRGNGPATVEREIDIIITRDEVIGILGQYIKRKLNTDQMRFDEIAVEAVKNEDGNDALKFSGVTLMGVEILSLQYPEGNAPVKAQPAAERLGAKPPVKPPVKPPLPPSLQSIAAAAAAQAKQTE